MLWYIALTLVLVWLIRTWINQRKLVQALPPSVPGWPLIGTLLNVKKMYLELLNLSKKYGDVYTLWQFGVPLVVVHSPELFEEVHQIANNRTNRLMYKVISAEGLQGDYNDPAWKHLRKVTFKALKSYGTLLKDLETLIHSEVEDFLTVLEEAEKKPVDPDNLIRITLCCTISTLMFGERLGRENPDLCKMLELVDERTEIFNLGRVCELDFFPWLRHFNSPYMRTIQKLHQKRDALLDGYLQRYKSKELSGGLVELLMNDEEGGLTDVQIKETMMDFLLGGIITTKTVSLALMILLLHHQAEQKKLQQEIDTVIGRSRPPKVEDQSDMPLLQAALLETIRFIGPAALGARSAHQNVDFRGYHIPAGTQFIVNFWALNHDGDFWENSDQWRPCRFLDDDGQLLPSTHPKRKRVDMLFGSGGRLCPGRHFAKVRLFMIFAAVLQRFDLRPDPDNPPPTLVPREMTYSITAELPAFKISFIPRD